MPDLSNDSFMAERGYFWDDPSADRRDGAAPTKRQKNPDFLRLKDEAVFMVDPRPGRVILELGCGAGQNLVYCGLQGATVYGQDIEPRAVEYANKKFAHFHIDGEARLGDASNLNFDDDFADAVLSSDFHEHLTANLQVAVAREACRVLKPGGVYAIKTPNLLYLRASLWFKRARAAMRGRDPRGFVIPHTPGTEPEAGHIGLSTRWQVDRCLLDAGFQHIEHRYAPLRRFGEGGAMTVASTEIPVVRDVLCEDLFVLARKPIALSHFPN